MVGGKYHYFIFENVSHIMVGAFRTVEEARDWWDNVACPQYFDVKYFEEGWDGGSFPVAMNLTRIGEE